MQNDKLDRRIKYTKLALRAGLITLLGRKPIDKISVKELCEAADINRSTFYAHYESPTDLLEQVEGELLRDLGVYLDAYNYKENADQSAELVTRVFEYVAENAELCRTVLRENGSLVFQRELVQSIRTLVEREWADKQTVDGEMLEYILTFAASGSIGIVKKWLESGLKKSPAEVATLVVNLTYRGLSTLA
jgi:AcrR family transcriptional regulator